MSDFLDLVERINAEAADSRALFARESGMTRIRPANTPEYKVRLAEAVNLLAGVKSGKLPTYRLQEAMTTSDFPYLMADILDRQMLAEYQEAPYSWNTVAHRSTVADFRQAKRFTLDGAEAPLSIVHQQEAYPVASLSDNAYTFTVNKYGRKIPLSWELVVNDDLNGFASLSGRLARAARRTEEDFVTRLYADATGPLSTFYTDGSSNGVVNALTGNPALSIASLQTAIDRLMNMRDRDGYPIMVEAMTLVVPPSLYVTARNLLNSTELRLNERGGTANQQLVGPNWMAQMIRLAVNYSLPIVSTTNGNTAWYLFADPARGRPAVEIGFLRGHEAPEIWIKEPNAIAVSGGGARANEDFDTDTIIYRVRHVLGGTLIDPRMSVASNGSGS